MSKALVRLAKCVRSRPAAEGQAKHSLCTLAIVSSRAAQLQVAPRGVSSLGVPSHFDAAHRSLIQSSVGTLVDQSHAEVHIYATPILIFSTALARMFLLSGADVLVPNSLSQSDRVIPEGSFRATSSQSTAVACAAEASLLHSPSSSLSPPFSIAPLSVFSPACPPSLRKGKRRPASSLLSAGLTPLTCFAALRAVGGVRGSALTSCTWHRMRHAVVPSRKRRPQTPKWQGNWYAWVAPSASLGWWSAAIVGCLGGRGVPLLSESGGWSRGAVVGSKLPGGDEGHSSADDALCFVEGGGKWASKSAAPPSSWTVVEGCGVDGLPERDVGTFFPSAVKSALAVQKGHNTTAKRMSRHYAQQAETEGVAAAEAMGRAVAGALHASVGAVGGQKVGRIYRLLAGDAEAAAEVIKSVSDVNSALLWRGKYARGSKRMGGLSAAARRGVLRARRTMKPLSLMRARKIAVANAGKLHKFAGMAKRRLRNRTGPPSLSVESEALRGMLEMKSKEGWSSSSLKRLVARTDLSRALSAMYRRPAPCGVVVSSLTALDSVLQQRASRKSEGPTPLLGHGPVVFGGVIPPFPLLLAHAAREPPGEHGVEGVGEAAGTASCAANTPPLVAILGSPAAMVGSARSKAVASVPSLRTITLLLCKVFVGCAAPSRAGQAEYLSNVANAVRTVLAGGGGAVEDATQLPIGEPTNTSYLNVAQVTRELKLPSSEALLRLLVAASEASQRRLSLMMPTSTSLSEGAAASSPLYERLAASPHRAEIISCMNSLFDYQTRRLAVLSAPHSPVQVARLAADVHAKLLKSAVTTFVDVVASTWVLAAPGCRTARVATLSTGEPARSCGVCAACTKEPTGRWLDSRSGRVMVIGELARGQAFGGVPLRRRGSLLGERAGAQRRDRLLRQCRRWMDECGERTDNFTRHSARLLAMHATGVAVCGGVPMQLFGTLKYVPLDLVLTHFAQLRRSSAAAEGGESDSSALALDSLDASYHAARFQEALVEEAFARRSLKDLIGGLPLYRALSAI